MKNKYIKIIKPSIMLSMITTFLIIIGFDTKFSIVFLIYGITLLILPILLKDTNVSLIIKGFLTLIIGLISVFTINYLVVRQRVLYLYIFFLLMAIIYSILCNLLDNKTL